MKNNILQSSQADFVEKYAGGVDRRRRMSKAVERQSETSHGMFTPFKKLIAFSLVELMISLITISCIAAAFTPVITKKLKKQDIALSLAQTSEISDVCGKESGLNFGNDTDGYKCKLCTKAYCIQCGLTDCGDGKYIDTKTCTCKRCVADGGLNNCKKCFLENGTLKCTLCEEGNGNKGTGYYLQKEGQNKIETTCQKCGNNNFCDDGYWEKAVSDCANPPTGYFCKNNKKYPCVAEYGTACTKCNSQVCLACSWFYQASPTGRGECISCKHPGCCTCRGCDRKDNCTACEGCCADHYFNNGVCTHCTTGPKATPNCMRCDDNGICYMCQIGYYLNANKKCESCNLDNCLLCEENKNNVCEHCKGGYYTGADGKCASCSAKFGSNCTSCNKDQCLTCKIHYRLTKTPNTANACGSDTDVFKCSDSNFMQIGKLCVTRRNMGDSRILTIPPTINVVSIDESCYTNFEKCCWKGKTAADSCTENKWGSYSGCTRTVCSHESAKEICSNFNYAGLKWRVPTPAETKEFTRYSANLGDNGLQICDESNSNVFEACPRGSLCSGAPYGCHPHFLAASTIQVWHISGGYTYSDSYGERDAQSIRCVADMTGTDLLD